MKNKYKSSVPRDKNGRFLLKNNIEQTCSLLGMAMVIFSIVALIPTIHANIVWLGIILTINILIGIVLMSIHQILNT